MLSRCWEHSRSLQDITVVTGTNGHKSGTTTPSGPHALSDRSRRPYNAAASGILALHPPPGIQLGRAAKPEQPPGHPLVVRAAARLLLIVDFEPASRPVGI